MLLFQDGLVYAVEFSHRSGRDLINVAKKRTNIIPIIEDARHPHKYRMLVGKFRPGIPKLVSPMAKADKTLFRPIKPTNPSVQMACKGQSSFGITAILPAQPYSGLLNPSVQMAFKDQIHIWYIG